MTNNILTITSVLAVLLAAGSYYVAFNVVRVQDAQCFTSSLRSSSPPFVEIQIMRGVAYVFEESERIEDIETQYQHVEVFKHPTMGHILVIDKSLQITSFDEHHYHEMMIHVPMAYIPNPTNVLIIGGGDGGALLRSLQYPSVVQANLIDIDMRVMREISQKYFPELSKAYGDKRTKAFAYDGNQWVREYLDDPTHIGSIDLAVVDSTDYGSAETLFTDEFYKMIQQLLNPTRSAMVLNLDSPSWNPEIVRNVQHQLAAMFKYSYVYQCNTPTFLGGHFSFLMLSDNIDPMTTPVDWAAWKDLGLPVKYYNPMRHYASFLLPKDVAEGLTMTGTLSA
eukprot:PhF_6_TR13597/c0_g1_i2/m.21756/K00797/speE, SRM; spermidine synthase